MIKKLLLNNYVIGGAVAVLAAICLFVWSGDGKDAASIAGVRAKSAPAFGPARAFKDWRLFCTVPGEGDKKRCQIMQVVGGGGKKPPALTAIVHPGQIKEKPVAVVVFMLPLGTLLQPGVTIKVDADKEIRVPYQQCRKGGCMVRVMVDRVRLDKIKAGKSMVVGYRLLDGKGKTVPVSLNGFAQALDAMTQESAKG